MFKTLSLPLLVLLFAGYVSAQQSGQQSGNSSGQYGSQSGRSDQSSQTSRTDSSKSGQHQNMHGTISKIDKGGSNLTLKKDNQQQQTVEVNPDTVVMLNGKQVTIPDLETGETATISADGDTAIRIDVVER